jgi:HEPN domain-containing protein
MTTVEISRDYLRKAKVRRKALQVLLDESSYDDVIRESQEIIELILKGALRFAGIEPPKRHDIGGFFIKNLEKFPDNWKNKLKEIEKISDTLFEERGHSFYGDESSMTPPSALFNKEQALRSISWVDELLTMYEQLICSVD